MTLHEAGTGDWPNGWDWDEGSEDHRMRREELVEAGQQAAKAAEEPE